MTKKSNCNHCESSGTKYHKPCGACGFVKFWVLYPVWADAEKSWKILVKCNENNSASTSFWFPKKSCTLEPIEGTQRAVLTIPKWLYNKNNLKEIINDFQYLSDETKI